MIKIIFVLCILVFRHWSISAAEAADSTPSADVKAQLEQLKIEIASKAAIFKEEVNRKLKDRAFVGKVKTQSQTVVTIATKNGPKIININQDTVYVSKQSLPPKGGNVKGKKFSLKLLSGEDYIAALGDVDETGALTAKSIVLLPTPTQEPKSFLWGQIAAISDEPSSSSSKLLTLKDKTGKNAAVSGNLKILKEGDIIILTGNMGKNDIFEAKSTFVVKSAKIETATSSAKEATKSSKP